MSAISAFCEGLAATITPFVPGALFWQREQSGYPMMENLT
jgi:hypothetical protein